MQILHDQLRGQERVLFASAQALLCGLALYMAHAVSQVLLLDAGDPADLNGRAANVMFWVLLVVSLAAAAATGFLAVTFARGARIGASHREALLFRAVALAIVGSVAASVALRF